MKKLLLTLITLASFASADYLFQPLNICVKEFGFHNPTGKYYYVRSDDGTTILGTEKNYGDDFFSGYDYNTTNSMCKKVASNNSLGLTNDDYIYFMSLTGLICGTLLSCSIFIGLRISA